MTGIGTIDCQMHHCSGSLTFRIVHAHALHKLAITCSYRMSVHLCSHAVAADFFHIGDTFHVRFLPGELHICTFQTMADGMCAVTLCQRRIGNEQPLLRVRRWLCIFTVLILMNTCHFKHALCNGSGLIKYHILCTCKRFQIIGALHQNPLIAGPSDSSKEAQRNADYQRTWTTDHKKGQRAINPIAPLRRKPHKKHPHNRRQNGQRQRSVADSRCVVTRKSGNKILRAGFLRARIFHQIQNFGYRRLPEFPCGLNLKYAGQIDASADDFFSCLYIPRNALPGQSRSIQSRASLHNHSIDRNLLARLHDNDTADRHFIRIHALQLSVLLYVGIVRADIHKLGNVPAALTHRIALKQFSNLVEQHNGDAFPVIPQEHGTHGCHRHQKILIEYLTVTDAFYRLFQYVIANNQIWNQIQ